MVLQLLIAVPLVVCVAFFSIASSESFVVTAQTNGPVYPSPVNYAPTPVCTSESCPPQLAGVPPFAAPMPASTFVPATLPPPIANVPAAPWNPEPATSTLPTPAQTAAIAEVRQRLGSPIDDAFENPAPPSDPTTYASAPVSPPTATIVPQSAPDLTVPPPTLSVTAPTNPLALETPVVGPPADASIGETTAPPAIASPTTEGACKIDPIEALLTSLQTSSTHLYILTDSLESSGRYGEADELRELARKIRDAASEISREHRAPPSPPAPATVTAASFDPAVVPASHEVPVPPAVAPAPFGGTRIRILEEDEAKLGIELP